MAVNLTDVLESEDRQTIRNLVTGDNNILINPNKVINQRAYAGGVLANGVYGYDRWKGADSDVNIEQVIEQLAINTGVHTVSWVGGGTATVAGTSGLSSGDSLTITVGGDISAKFPKSSTKMKLEPLEKATPFEQRPIGLELELCKRYFERISQEGIITTTLANMENYTSTISYGALLFAEKRVVPSISISDLTNFQLLGVGTNFAPSVLTILQASKQSATISFTTSGLTQGYASHFRFTSVGGGYIDIDSEL